MDTWSEVAGLGELKEQKIEDFEASKDLNETYIEVSHIVFSSKEDLILYETIAPLDTLSR